MLLRISLIVAILAGLGAGGIGYYEWSTQIPALTKQRDDEHTAKVEKINELASTNKVLKATLATLTQTQTELADTKSDRAEGAKAGLVSTFWLICVWQVRIAVPVGPRPRSVSAQVTFSVPR